VTAASLASSNSLVDLAARIRSHHDATKAALKTGIDHAMAAGDLLIEAKAQIPHGIWLPWLKEHCAVSERTARLYMRLARNRSEIEIGNVADLSVRGALALITLLPEGLVASTGDVVAEIADTESAIVAFEKSEAERNVRRTIYADIDAALARLRPDTPIIEAVWEELGDELVSAINECLGELKADLDVEFACSPQATLAAERAKNLAAEMLRRVEAAS